MLILAPAEDHMPYTDRPRTLTALHSRRWAIVFAALLLLTPPAIFLFAEGASPEAAGILFGVTAPVAAWFILLSIRSSTSLSHTHLTQQFAIRRKVTDLRTIDGAELVSNGAGTLTLRMIRETRPAAGLDVMMMTDYVTASLAPAELEFIADVLTSLLGEDTNSVAVLRAQSSHLRAGGELAISPFALLISQGTARVGRAGAIGAGGSNLLG